MRRFGKSEQRICINAMSNWNKDAVLQSASQRDEIRPRVPTPRHAVPDPGNAQGAEGVDSPVTRSRHGELISCALSWEIVAPDHD